MITEKKIHSPLLLLLSAVFILSCCEGRYDDVMGILVPLGAAGSDRGKVSIQIDRKEFDFNEETDAYGNVWARIPVKKIGIRTIVSVRYTVRKAVTGVYHDNEVSPGKWLSPNRYIDADNPSIVKTAHKIFDPDADRAENVRKMSHYVVGHCTFSHRFSYNPAKFTASETLTMGKGVCINYSRLLVAMLRSCGIPSRTVCGAVLSGEDSSVYDCHHEWVEWLDIDKNWHPMDMTYSLSFDLNDSRYRGFIYGAEDHSFFRNIDMNAPVGGKSFILPDGDLITYHFLPVFTGARYGFNLVSMDEPGIYTIEKKMILQHTGKRVSIIHMH